MRKLKRIQPFGHSEASKTKKFRQILLIFPVLGKMTHMHFLAAADILRGGKADLELGGN